MKNKKKFMHQNKILTFLIIIATLFMGIGYASVNSISLDINGTLVAKEQDGVYIKSVKYIEDNNANTEQSTINNYYQTMLDSTIILSNIDLESSITYLITFYNNSNKNYYYSGTVFSNNFYDNNDIIYELNDISLGELIKPYSELSFSITFKYSSEIDNITNNILNSYINFKFLEPANMKSASNGYNGEFWNYKTSITKIVFQNEITDIDNSISFDVSEEKNETVMSRLVSNGDDTYTLYLQSNSIISAPVNSSYLFSGFTKLQSIENINYLETSKVTNMNNMFSENSSLISLDLSSFDTSKVTNMSYMFNNNKNMTDLNVNGFNTSKVTNMGHMFSFCNSLTSLVLSDFDTSNVTDMTWMFVDNNKITNLDLSNFVTNKVTSMDSMFYGCNSLTSLNVSNFNTEKVTTMNMMFYKCSNLTELNISSFNTSKVTTMGNMFGMMVSITDLDLSNFDTSNVTDMNFMFSACLKLKNLNVTSFDTSNVKNMSFMFLSCQQLETLDLISFDMSGVTNTGSMLNDTGSIKNAYARTEEDAAILNAISGKPTTYTFVVKN